MVSVGVTNANIAHLFIQYHLVSLRLTVLVVQCSVYEAPTHIISSSLKGLRHELDSKKFCKNVQIWALIETSKVSKFSKAPLILYTVNINNLRLMRIVSR
jgi:hypothetical protein